MAREFQTPVDLRAGLLIDGGPGTTGQAPTRQSDGSLAWQTPSGGASTGLVRIDASATTTTYVGRAAAGTAESATGWTVVRTTYTALGVLQTTATGSGAWTNRTSLTYS